MPRTVPSSSVVPSAHPPLPTLHEEYASLNTRQNETTGRIQALESQAQAQGFLAEDEESELLRLRLRLEHLGPRRSQLLHDIGHAQQRADIASVQTQWELMMAEKHTRYEAFRTAIATLLHAFDALTRVHAQQEALIGTLPLPLQAKLLFIDINTFRARVCGALPHPQGWTSVLCVPTMMPNISLDALTANDPGSKPLPPRILAPFVGES